MPSLFQNDHAFSMRRISASGSSARNTALPATSTSAPASKSSRAFADEMPPSTSISVSSPMRRFISSRRRTFSTYEGMNDCPPNPGSTLITNTISTSGSSRSNTPTSVAGLIEIPARAPAACMASMQT